MVDVSTKTSTLRTATSRTVVILPPSIASLYQSVKGGGGDAGVSDIFVKKGAVFTTAIIAGTMAVKNTSNMIPFCHPIPIESCKFNIRVIPKSNQRQFNPNELSSESSTESQEAESHLRGAFTSGLFSSSSHSLSDSQCIFIDCTVITSTKTGVEMESLVGGTSAALCIYDMCKGISHDIIIGSSWLREKTGGKSGVVGLGKAKK